MMRKFIFSMFFLAFMIILATCSTTKENTTPAPARAKPPTAAPTMTVKAETQKSAAAIAPPQTATLLPKNTAAPTATIEAEIQKSAAAIAPTQAATLLPTNTALPSPTATVQEGWVRYTNEQYGFQLDHPNLSDCNDQCGIGAFINLGDIEPVTTLAIESTMMPGTDAPFDGMSLDVFANPDGISLHEFVEAEKQAILAGPGLIGGSLDETPYNAGGQTGISMKLSGSISRAIYIPFPGSNKVLIVSIGNHTEGSFEETADQILATLQFNGKPR